MPSESASNSRWAFLILLAIFISASLLLLLIYLNFPRLDKEEWGHVKLPKDIEDAKRLGKVLSRYKNKFFYSVMAAVFVTYIFLQSFAIPGSIFLSIMSGYLFSFPVALLLVCTCSAVGATLCYLLSYLVGRELVLHYWPDKVQQWSMKVSKHREHLLNYMIFLRITPFLPNFFINVASPVIDVPLSPFFWGTFIGVGPPSCFFIQAGTTLQQLTDAKSAFSWTSVVVLGVLAILALLPVFFKQRFRDKID